MTVGLLGQESQKWYFKFTLHFEYLKENNYINA